VIFFFLPPARKYKNVTSCWERRIKKNRNRRIEKDRNRTREDESVMGSGMSPPPHQSDECCSFLGPGLGGDLGTRLLLPPFPFLIEMLMSAFVFFMYRLFVSISSP